MSSFQQLFSAAIALCLVANQPALGQDQDDQRIRTGIELMRMTCGTASTQHNNLQVQGQLNGGLTLKTLPGIQGGASITYSQEEVEGLAANLRKELTEQSVHLSETQIKCMQGYADRIFDVLFPLKTGQLGPGLTQPPKIMQVSSSEAIKSATQLAHLILESSGTPENITERLSAPYCAENIVLQERDEVLNYIKGGYQLKKNYGNIFIKPRDVKTIGELDIGSPYSPVHEYSITGRAIKKCEEEEIIFPFDYIVFIETTLIDFKRKALLDVIVERKSGLIKGFFVEGY